MHLPLPFSRSTARRRHHTVEGRTLGHRPDPGQPDPGQPDPGQPDPGQPNPRQPGPRQPGPMPSATVLPRLRRPHPTRAALAGFLSTVAAAVTISVAAIAPSPQVLAEQASVASPPVGVPAAPAGLPAGIEALAGYVPQTSCDPTAKPGVLRLSQLLRTTYPGTSAWSPRPCGADGMGARSEHYEGRALDWSVSIRNPLAARRASALLGWLLATDAAGHRYANARRLGIMYIIWNDRIWGSYRASEGWRPYGQCAAHRARGYDTSCHRDHIHFSLSWSGAQGRTSFWTRRVAGRDYGPCRPANLNWAPRYNRPRSTPCPGYATVRARPGVSAVGTSLVAYSGAVIGPGSTGPVVSAVQRALGLGVDGQFGPLTGAGVSSFRTRHRLPAGSQVDAATWRALLAAYATPAAARPAGGTTTTRPAPAAPAAPASALSRYSGTILRYGSRGAGVVAVQKALRVTPHSGWFGPLTLRAVRAFQGAHGIPRTGNVGPLTWRALQATAAPAASRPAGGTATSPSALSRYSGTILRYGSRSAGVVEVQKALRVTPHSGWFGPLTLRAVRAFQGAHGIPRTGNVGPLTWRALGA